MGKPFGLESGIYTMPVGATAYTKGDFYVKGDWSGVCLSDGEANLDVAVQTEGGIQATKTPANLVCNQGDKLYSTDNEATVNKTSASRKLVGYCLLASSASDKYVWCDLVKGNG